MTESHGRTSAVTPFVLDRASPLPLQYQLREQVRDRLAAGWVPVGGLLPPLLTLADAAGVSRNTARLALAALAAEGVVQHTQGARARVLVRPLPGPPSGHPLLAPASPRVERVERVRAPAAIARVLGLAAAAPIYRCTRLRLWREQAVAVEVLHLPVATFPNLHTILRTGEPLYAALAERYQTIVLRAEERVQARLLDAAIARRLALAEPAVGLLLERVVYTAEGPIEVRYCYLANTALHAVLHLSRAQLESG